jgi:hypothetical protein
MTKKLDTEPVSLTLHSVVRKCYAEPSIGASYQISVHLAKRLKYVNENKLNGYNLFLFFRVGNGI